MRRNARAVGALVLSVGMALASGAFGQAPAWAAVDNDLINPSFEEPAIKSIPGYQLIPIASGVRGWQTTDTQFEIWRAFYMGDANGIGAYAGKQYAELNASKPGTLFQDIATVPGQTLRWRIAHRPRGKYAKPDVMRVLAAAPGAELVPLIPDERDGEPWTPTGTGIERADIADGGQLPDGSFDVKWHVWSGTYIVPAGQVKTRFGFQAVSSGSGLLASGNFLDAIEFGKYLPTEYTLTYDPNGGQCAAPEQKALEKTAAVVNDGSTCSRAGYVFKGWNTQQDGTGAAVAPGSELVLGRNQTLYAVWEKLAEWTLTYESNGGVCTAPAQTAPDKASLDIATASACTRDGHTLTGWNDAKDGSGKTYLPGTSIQMTKNQTLFAVWAKAEDSFVYQVCAPNGGPCETATVTISVTPPPVVRAKTAVVVAVPPRGDAPVVFTPPLPPNPSTPDAQTPTDPQRPSDPPATTQPPVTPEAPIAARSLALAKVGASSWGKKIVMPNKGTWTIKNGSVVFTPAANFYGRVSIQYRVIEADGSTKIQTLTASRAAVPGTIEGGRAL